MIGPFLRLGLFGLLVLAVVMASQPASASKKRPKHDDSDSESSESKSGKSGKGSKSKESDDDGDADEAPAKKPSKPAAPRPVSAALAASSGLPDWREGTGWTVKTVYRRLPAGRVNKDTKPDDVSIPGWSDPTYWAYLVKKVKGGEAITQYLLQVKNKDGSRAAMASLYFARYPMGAEVLALNRGKFYSLMAGQLKPTNRLYVTPGGPPHPILADDSLIPYDFPALPFQAKAPASAKETSLARTFTITEELDGLKFARDVTQVELQNTTVEAFAGKELAEYIKSKGWSTSDLSFVEFRRKFDGMVVKQVWSSKLPWCIYSESLGMRSWLWDQEAPKPETPKLPGAIPSAAPSPEPSAQE